MIEKDLKNFINNALKEDVGDGDHTSLASIPANATSKAHLLVKDDGVIAGIELAKMILKEVDSSLEIEQFLQDGDKVKFGDIAFIVKGNSISILTGERLALNCMQHMSAIATKTAYLNTLIEGTDCKLLDTRKTTPLNRTIEKWAVKIGGGVNHRFGLYDMIMIKDNHIDFAGGISNAIQKTKTYLADKNKNLDIIVEARGITEVNEILAEGGIKRILLDNFDYKTTKEAVAIIGNKCQSESSGGITEKSIAEYAKCGVDFISVGALTHSVLNFDLSLKAF
ncbi:MAG: carboxylating nicotinate-nucleotide diphosphorylase [Flavobacteriales bacterium]|jgi:nicotinate-nucleotide pyrophosphorylase (carboxylating)|nr:carboxylating nicotinate-nucleotide diphosphorylase [Flavobacteriales bacterium]MDC3395162.1 carboxylating nicotinate-nucleotide diphosphorylase [Flavobacteriales bacterium]MDG1349011.1 carboxylating nicotinate-nucleotide diphosphorylase [Flavobacteriales bacterium]